MPTCPRVSMSSLLNLIGKQSGALSASIKREYEHCRAPYGLIVTDICIKIALSDEIERTIVIIK